MMKTKELKPLTMYIRQLSGDDGVEQNTPDLIFKLELIFSSS